MNKQTLAVINGFVPKDGIEEVQFSFFNKHVIKLPFVLLVLTIISLMFIPAPMHMTLLAKVTHLLPLLIILPGYFLIPKKMRTRTCFQRIKPFRIKTGVIQDEAMLQEIYTIALRKTPKQVKSLSEPELEISGDPKNPSLTLVTPDPYN